MVVLRAELLEQRDRLGERSDALYWSVRHVDDRASVTRHGLHVRALADEILNHLVVAARGGVMERRVAVRVALIDVGTKRLDEILHRGEPAVGGVTMRVTGKTVSVADA